MFINKISIQKIINKFFPLFSFSIVIKFTSFVFECLGCLFFEVVAGSNYFLYDASISVVLVRGKVLINCIPFVGNTLDNFTFHLTNLLIHVFFKGI